MQCPCRKCESSEEKEFAGYTSLHGLGRLTGGRPWYAKAFWVLACLGGWAILLLQLWSLIADYRLFRTTTSIRIDYTPELKFPAVTLCGFNRINGTALEHELHIPRNDTELLEYIIDSFDAFQLLPIKAETQERAKTIHKRYQYYSGREWNFTEILEIASKKDVKSFVRECFYWPNLPDNVTCNNENAFWHSYTAYGSCLTFNHFKCQFKVNNATTGGSNNGLRLLINLDPTEITGTLRTGHQAYGLRIHVHPKHEPPQLIEDFGYVIRPGSYVTVGVETELYVSEVPPWSDCVSSPNKLEDFTEYSVFGCDVQCRARYIREKCGCNLFTLVDTPNDMRSCEKLDRDNCTGDALYWYFKMSEKERAESCGQSVCLFPCSYLAYSLIVSSAAYPSPLLGELMRQSGQTSENSSAILLDINFSNMFWKEFKEERATTITELMSNFGGQMGLCIGASVLTLAEIGEYITFKIQLLFWWLRGKRRPECRCGNDVTNKPVEMKGQTRFQSDTNLVTPGS